MIVLNILLMAVECFFGGSLLLGLALVLSHGKTASLRHLLFTGAFAAMLLLPLAAWLVPSQMVWLLAAPQAVSAVPAAAPAAPAGGVDPALAIFGLCALWAMGAVFVLSKAAFGGVALAYLHRHSVPHIPAGMDGVKFRGLKWQVRLRTIPGDAGPITYGLFKPVVLLPKGSVDWPRARLEAVLLHEAAHVRRRDCLSRLIALLACALYWPNPLVWMAAFRMRRDGETAADDCVLNCGIKASAYAEHLVGLARAFNQNRPSYAGVSLAMAERAMLDVRVEAILNPTRSRKAVTRKDVVKIAALGLTATAAIALLRPSLAEAPPLQAEARSSVQRVSGAPKRSPRVARAVSPSVPPVPQMPPEPPAAPVQAPAPPPEPSAARAVIQVENDGSEDGQGWDVPHIDAVVVRADIEKAAAAIARSEQMRAMRENQAEVRRALAQAQVQEHMARAKMAEAQSKMAVAQAHAAEALRRAGGPDNIQIAVNNALAKVNISAIISDALEKARPALEKAAAAGKAPHIQVSVQVDGDADN